MSPAGSALPPPSAPAPPPFPLPTALALTALGILAMFGGGTLLATRSGLGIRTQIVVGTLLLAIPALAALALDPARWPAVVGPRPATRRLLALSVLLGAALWVASAGLMEVQSLVAPPPQSYLDAFRAIHAALAPRNLADALVSILVIAVLPGLCEELVVRGVCLPSLARWWSGSTAVPVVATALLFAAIHFDFYRGAFTFALGLVLRSAAAHDRVALALGARPPEPQHADVPGRPLRGRPQPAVHAVSTPRLPVPRRRIGRRVALVPRVDSPRSDT